MKKTFWSLAALMLMAAPMMTSCSNDVDEVAPAEEVKENVVTLTIKMPEQTETRVGINNETLKLTGWELGNIVKVYDVRYIDVLEVNGGIPFTCTDPESGTFTGTLPDGKTLDNYNFAVYGPDVIVTAGNWAGFLTKKISSNLADVICLAGEISSGSCSMAICNNVLKVTNEGSAVDVAWKNFGNGIIFSPYCEFNDYNHFAPRFGMYTASFSDAKFNIPTGVSYVLLPPMQFNLGLVNESDVYVVEAKNFGNDPVFGKLFKKTIGATGGSVEFAKSNTNISWSGSGSPTLTGTDSQSGIILTLTRSSGNITRNATMGTISFAGAMANETITISVTGGTCTSVTNSLTSKTLEGAGPWTLTFKESPSVGWYTSGGEAFINAINLANTAKLTVVYE